MPIRFLFPILIAIALAAGLWVTKKPVVPASQTPAPVESIATTPLPAESSAPSEKQEVVSAPPKTVVVKPPPNPPAPKVEPAPVPPPAPKPASAPIPQPIAPKLTPATQPVVTSGYEQQLLAYINDYRAERGLKSLASSSALYILAKDHSDDMATRNDLNHDGFQDRFKKANRTECVENVGWNYATPEGQLKGWQDSPLHNANLLNPHITLVGIAQSGTYVTFFACQ